MLKEKATAGLLGLRTTLTGKITLGLLSGAAAGLFLGEHAVAFGFLGEIFLRLLQMTVLPFVVLSLVQAIGGQTADQARTILRNGCLVVGGLWLVGLAVVHLMPLAFPRVDQALFYAASAGGPAEPLDLLDHYFPTNLFKALSENFLPAIILFCIGLGAALIPDRDKDTLMQITASLLRAVTRVTDFVIRLSPIGIFGLTARSVGTTDLARLPSLMVYVGSFEAAALVLTFVIMPAGLAACTPFSWRTILNASKSALFMAYATGSAFVALPILDERIRELFKDRFPRNQSPERTVPAILPILYNLPSLGAMLPILFILFVCWFYKSPLDAMDRLQLAASGMLHLAGSDQRGVLALLKEMRLPDDAYSLYLQAGDMTRKFLVLTTAMFLFTACTACTALSAGLARLRPRRILAAAGISAGVLVLVLSGLRFGLSRLLAGTYHGGEIVSSMRVAEPVEHTVLAERPAPDPAAPPRVLDRIKATGRLRVGFDSDLMPFCYVNRFGELAGYDVAAAHALADDLDCRLEFVPLDPDRIGEDLTGGVYDVAMSKITVAARRLPQMTFSAPYMTLRAAFVVGDLDIDDFASLEGIRDMDGLTVGAYRRDRHVEAARAALPKARIVFLDSHADFFGNHPADVLLTTAEEGATWTLLHPSYGVASPEPPIFTDTIAYAVPMGDVEFAGVLDTWMSIRRQSGWMARQYDYWVLGRDLAARPPRWSVVRNVLGWVD